MPSQVQNGRSKALRMSLGENQRECGVRSSGITWAVAE